MSYGFAIAIGVGFFARAANPRWFIGTSTCVPLHITPNTYMVASGHVLSNITVIIEIPNTATGNSCELGAKPSGEAKLKYAQVCRLQIRKASVKGVAPLPTNRVSPQSQLYFVWKIFTCWSWPKLGVRQCRSPPLAGIKWISLWFQFLEVVYLFPYNIYIVTSRWYSVWLIITNWLLTPFRGQQNMHNNPECGVHVLLTVTSREILRNCRI